MKEQEYQINEVRNEYQQDNFRAQNIKFKDNEELLPFFLISDLFDLLKDIKGKSSTLKKRLYVQRFFEIILHKFKNELIDVYNFCCLRTDVEWLQKDLGVGFEYLQNSVKLVTGMTTKQIREQYQKEGDLGKILEEQKQGQNSITSFFVQKKKVTKKRITFSYIFKQIKELAYITGEKTKNRKTDLIVNLLRSAKPNEGKYILRFLEKNFKIGAAQKLFQLSFSKALRNYFNQMNIDCFPQEPLQEFNGDIDFKKIGNFLNFIDQNYYKYLCQEDQEKIWDAFFQKVISQFPDVKTFFNNIFTYKLIPIILKNSSINPSTPCKPMLAHPTKSIQQVFKRLENNAFTCEYKYDGLRGQIHYDKKNNLLKIFSRNLEDLTLQYPDIVQSIRQIEQAQQINIPDSFILDSEIVAFDQKTNRILPFQILTTRSKKDVVAEEQKVKVSIFIFDILYINGKSLLQKTFRERRKILTNLVDKCYSGKEIQVVTYKDCQEVNEIQEFLDQSVKDCCEGLMVKPLDQNSTYEPAKRSFKWLKVKKDYIENEGIGDSLDLVVIGAKYGTGKRTGKFGAYLVACYDPDYDTFEGCCIVGTGYSDQNLEDFHQYFHTKIIQEKPDNYLLEKSGYVDVWFEPIKVWEIKVADIQVSPVYKCAQNFVSDNNKGLGLRFPRFIRERQDKNPIDSTNPQQIYDIYRNQAAVAYIDDDNEDYY